jgi:hypothetical protein
MTDSTQSSQVLQGYEQRIAELRKDEQKQIGLDRRFGIARVVIFLATCLLGLLGFVADDGVVFLWLAAGAFLGFIGIALRHDGILNRLEMLKTRRLVNERRMARWRRDWEQFPVPKTDIPDEFASLANDLNLFGRASLFQWLCVANTSMGRETLRDWILYPASPEVIRDRQAKVKVLAKEKAWREDLEVTSKLLAASPRGPQAFIDWSEGEIWQDNHPVLRWFARLLPILTFTLPVLLLADLASPTFGWVSGLSLLLAQAVISLLHTGTIHDAFDSVAARQREVWHYVSLLEIVSQLPADVADSKGLDIRETAKSAIPELIRLGRISNFAAARHGGIFGVFFFIASFLLLIDFHILTFMEKWQRRCGQRVRSWFDAIGELEATACLANVTHDHPDWSFPRVDRSETRVIATDFGHPLLPNDARVNNTVEVGPAGRFLLVSGSNMSGKSTLLRSLGVSAVLAQMGGPVAAGELRLPPMTIATSMRVHDSLEDGVSFFMAELQRLKEIVDMSRAHRGDNARVLFFLLDEILQGTNSVERHIAVIRVLRHLVGQGAMGAISTHDLDLARSEDLEPHCDAVYFREQIARVDGSGQMTFDYRIRDGVATTTNALRLLELVGLSDVEDDL